MARHESEAAEGLVYQWDEDWVDRRYEVLNLRVIHRRHRTGFEETKDFPIRVNDLVAGRYQAGTRAETANLVQPLHPHSWTADLCS